jgi:glycosyltransferase involved in cell wall biosynthesis
MIVMSDILFSIIIPTLNEENYLPNLLADLQKQKEKNFEVIIVDAHSEDKTCKKATVFREKLDIHILRTDNRNVCHQRNIGAQKAIGKYVLFMDADASISKVFLAKIKKHILKKPALIYIPIMHPKENALYAKLQSFTAEISKLIGKPFVPSSCVVFERNFFDFINGYDEKVVMAEDQEIIQRAFNYGVSARLMKDVLVKFSLRRFEHEGKWTVYSKYVIASVHILTKGKIQEKIFDYEMGGNPKYVTDKKKRLTLEKRLADSLNHLKLILEQ